MKNIFKAHRAILFFLLVTVLSGCIVEPAETRGKITQQGKNIYDQWNSDINNLLTQNVKTAFDFNLYYTAANDSARINVEDSLFSCYKIRDVGDGVWQLYQGATLYCEINTANQSLSEVGAVWNVKIPTSLYLLPILSTGDSLSLTITCSTATSWLIGIQGNGNPSCYVDLILTGKMPNFSLAGNGRFGYNSYYSVSDSGQYSFIEFTVKETMTSTKPDYWSGGLLDLKAFNLQNQEKTVEVEFLHPSENSYAAKITSDGATETWDLYAPYYY